MVDSVLPAGLDRLGRSLPVNSSAQKPGAQGGGQGGGGVTGPTPQESSRDTSAKTDPNRVAQGSPYSFGDINAAKRSYAPRVAGFDRNTSISEANINENTFDGTPKLKTQSEGKAEDILKAVEEIANGGGPFRINDAERLAETIKDQRLSSEKATLERKDDNDGRRDVSAKSVAAQEDAARAAAVTDQFAARDPFSVAYATALAATNGAAETQAVSTSL